MKRRIITILLLIALIGNMLPLSGCGKSDGDAVTRGEWVSMLAQTFGMDSYGESEPYYADVTAASDIFAYVQSSAEWDVLSVFYEEQLGIDEKVTAEEVASTAAIAAGYKISDDEFNEDGKYDTEGSVAFALQHNIVPGDKKLSKNMSLEECEVALENARDAYLNAPMEEKLHVVKNEDLVDLSDVDAAPIGNGSQVALAGDVEMDATGNLQANIETATGVVTLGAGDVFISEPTPEAPAGVAYKVVFVEEFNGEVLVTTEAPELTDIYEELDIQTTVEADPSAIIWEPGVLDTQSGAQSVSSSDGTYQIALMAAPSAEPKVTFLDSKTYSTGFSKSFEFGKGEFEKTWTNQNSSALGAGEEAQAFGKSNFVYDKMPGVEDFAGKTESWTENLQVENKFSGGYKITGTIDINAITVKTSIDYKKAFGVPYGVKSASVQVTSDISSTLTFEGNLKEELKIATIPIPIAATGLSVSVDLYLYADASGSLVITAKLGNSAKVEYAKEKLKHAADSTAEATVDAAIEVNFGADLCATLNALGIIKVIDAGARAGGELTAGAHVGGMCRVSEEDGVVKTTYQQTMNLEADLYAPVVSIYAGGEGTLMSKLGLSKEWDVMTKENGAKHFKLVDYEWVFWEETVISDSEGNVTDSESVTAGEIDGVGSSDENRLNLKTYVLTLTGESVRIELDLAAGETAPDVVWTSDDPGIASVDQTGLVSPVSSGNTIITATLLSDPTVYVKCAVYVEEIGENNWEFLPDNMAYVI